ncbi:MAG TPA: hypothetical protein VIC26_08605 [Marinagarivorans sp.]
MKALSAFILSLFMATALTACDDGGAENIGENIDDSMHEVKDSLDDVGDNLEDACEDATDSNC